MSRKTVYAGVILFLSVPLSFKLAAQSQKLNQAKLFTDLPRYTPRNPPARPSSLSRIHSAYRSYDGTKNNISNDQSIYWGSADIQLYREMLSEYGPTDINNAMAGPDRPSARKISNVLCEEPVTIFNARGLSSFVYVWGQFVDHDMTLTPTDTTEYVPVSLPDNEPLFTEEIPFYRSEIRSGTGITTPREQTNLNTAWIDASMVYGSDEPRARWLRTFKDGKMKTSTGNLLPYNTVTGELDADIDPNAPAMANDMGKTVKTFVAGDIRAAEHPGLASLHTIFVREHNSVCNRLIKLGFNNDEDIYQRARKEVGALIEAITYQEFLPAIGISLSPYRGYNKFVRADLTNIFATAGYRLGHTMVADDILLFDNQCEEVFPGELDLVDVFWNPALIPQYGPEPFLKGFAAHTQYETNLKINEVLRSFLFAKPTDEIRFGLDLAALNIQRGRDHGLPNYNAVRKYYTGNAAANFSDISSDPSIAASLNELYGSVDNVDLWVGILAEDLLPGKSVGKTIHEIVRTQFEKLRDGDFYFYLNDPYLSWFTRWQISNTRFSDVLKRNTSLTNLQQNVFFTEECPSDEVETTAAQVQEIKADNNGFKVCPNPVTNEVNIDLSNLDKPSTIQLFTSSGRLMKTIIPSAHEKSLRINTSNFASGIYIINVITNNKVQSFKFVKL